MYVIIASKTGNHILIKSQDKLVITKGYGVQATTNEGQNAFVQRFALRKFHATDGQNARDHITSNRRFKRARSNCFMCIPFILSGRPNDCWLHTGDACVITTWRLGLHYNIT